MVAIAHHRPHSSNTRSSRSPRLLSTAPCSSQTASACQAAGLHAITHAHYDCMRAPMLASQKREQFHQRAQAHTYIACALYGL